MSDTSPSEESVLNDAPRRRGQAGGLARAVNLTPERRREVARQAAVARWRRRRTVVASPEHGQAASAALEVDEIRSSLDWLGHELARLDAQRDALLLVLRGYERLLRLIQVENKRRPRA